MKNSYAEALAIHDHAQELAEQTGDPETELLVRGSVPTGIYEHFKSAPDNRKYYAVEEVGRDVDDGLYRVSYRALYGKYRGMLAFRELVGVEKGFLMPIDRPEISYSGPRFVLIRRCPREMLSEISREYMK